MYVETEPTRRRSERGVMGLVWACRSPLCLPGGDSRRDPRMKARRPFRRGLLQARPERKVARSRVGALEREVCRPEDLFVTVSRTG